MLTRFGPSGPRLAAAALAIAGLAGCEDAGLPTSRDVSAGEVSVNRTRLAALEAPAPSAVATLGGRSFAFWPYTGTSFDGRPQDPVNVIFLGAADPREIRAALLALDGNRTAFGFPPVFPFDCTWSDAIGGMQTAFAADAGWLGSAVQLECGPYGPVRFHVRLFRGEGGTIGNVHLDLQIPGTSEHQVLSWALPQQLLTADLARTGLLGAAPTPTAQTHSPFFGEIPAAIWNGMPPELRQLTGHSPTAPGPVPILSTGYAMQFELAGRVPVTPDEEVEDFVVQWNQIIPKPFCAASPAHFVRVEGPLRFTQRSGIDASGEYHMEMLAQGTLRITPINPPDGSFESYDAEILVNHVGTVTDPMTKTLLNDLRRELPDIGIFRGTSHNRVQTGPTATASMHLLDVDC